MKIKSKEYSRTISIVLGLLMAGLVLPTAVFAQDIDPAGDSDAGPQLIAPAAGAEQSETVTINVKDANISEVLKAYSLQTGQSIVVGPDVVSDNVNVRLNNIPWQEALDVILKPYGFGYRVVGGTIVVSKLENIVQVEGIEPLVSKVFILKYLDAYDVKNVVEAQLTARGKITVLSNKGLPGWEFGGSASKGGSSGSRSGSTIGTAARKEVDPIEKSKTIIVTDVPSAVTAIGTILEQLDNEPKQVLIESRFVEVGTGVLRDMGVDFATSQGGLATPGVDVSNPTENNQWGVEQNDSLIDSPFPFDAMAGEALLGSNPYNSGLQLLFSRVAGENFEILLHALEEDGNAHVLSAPKVLTLDNQEAAILVGTKFPIIESNSSGSGGSSTTVSTSLDYYESIGIQLNVIPQVSNEEYVNMIIHPVVSEIDRYEQGVVLTTGDNAPLTRYPVLTVREAQTQILLKSGDSAIIGGLQQERERKSEHGVPLLKDIPLLGQLFKRTTTNVESTDLLIFIKATIVENEAYATESAATQNQWDERIGRTPEAEEAAEAEEADLSSAEKEQMVSFVNDDMTVEPADVEM